MKVTLEPIIREAIRTGASDIHITVGLPPVLRINGSLEKVGSYVLTAEDLDSLVHELASPYHFSKFEEDGETDLAYSFLGLCRYRVNIFKDKGNSSIALRTITSKIPTMEDLKLPIAFRELCKKKRGLILVTGPTGSGKSTTLASMVGYINQHRKEHIITIEDPIEYEHKHINSIVNQRELGRDTQSFANALRASLREDPDVILVGEMRDLETISTAITAAETGHLVMSTLHTIGASKTVDRIVDIFPPHQQRQVVSQLSGVIEAVISQQLLPRSDGKGRTLALEVMLANPAIRNLIREGKTHQIQTVIQTNYAMGMRTMDGSLVELFKNGIISQDSLFDFAVDKEVVKSMLVKK